MSKPVVLFTNDLIDLMIGLFAFIIPSPGRGGRRLSKVQRGLLVVSGRAVNNVSGAAPAGSEMELRRAAAPNCTPANLLRWSKICTPADRRRRHRPHRGAGRLFRVCGEVLVLDFRRPGAAHAHLQTERLAALAAWADPLLISLLSMAAPKLPRVFRPRRRRRLISAASDRRRTCRARASCCFKER